jgi:hypothetical protein
LLESLTHQGIASPPVEVLVKDEVGNEYSAIIPPEIFEPTQNDG